MVHISPASNPCTHATRMIVMYVIVPVLKTGLLNSPLVKSENARELSKYTSNKCYIHVCRGG